MRDRRSLARTTLEGPFTAIARVMAQRWKINIVGRGLCPRTDGNTIFFPWNVDNIDSIPFQVLNGWLDHEVGHIIEERVHEERGDESPLTLLRSIPNPAIRLLMNGLEDVRMERERSVEWPGVAENLRAAFLYTARKIASDGAEGGLWLQLTKMIVLDSFGAPLDAFSPQMIWLYSKVEAEVRRVDDARNGRACYDIAHAVYNKVKELTKSEDVESDDGDDEDEEEGDDGEGSDGDGEEEESEKKDSKKKDSDDEAGDEDMSDDEESEGGKDEDDDEGGAEGKDEEEDEGEDEGEEDPGESNSDEEESDEPGDEGEEGDGDEGDEDEGESDHDADSDEETGKSEGSSFESGESPEHGEDDDESERDSVHSDIPEPSDEDLDELRSDAEVWPESDHLMDELEEEVRAASIDDARRSYVPHPDMVAQDKWEKGKEHNPQRYAAIREEAQGQTSAMRARLRVLLESQATSRPLYDQDEGRLDEAALYSLRTGNKSVRYTLIPGVKVNTAIEVLIDLSASMGPSDFAGRMGMEHAAIHSRARYARTVAVGLGEALDSIQIPFEMIGFYNRYKFSRAGAASAEEDRYTVPRLPFTYVIYKGWEESYKRVRTRLVGITGHEENVDGEAVLAVAQRLARRKEERKILIVLSDGDPCCPGLPRRLGADHLRESITRVSKAGIEVCGVGLNHADISQFYNDSTGAKAIVINDLSCMARDVFALVRSKLVRGVK